MLLRYIVKVVGMSIMYYKILKILMIKVILSQIEVMLLKNFEGIILSEKL